MDQNSLEQLKASLIDAIDTYLMPHPAEIAPKWEGGKLIMQPGGDTQAKDIPLDVFFKKIVSVRDSLRVLEQKINTHEKLTGEEKATLQGYITKAYGSLTTFNVLFREGKDRFVGSGGGGDGGASKKDDKLSVGEAKRRLGLREY